MDVRHRRGYFDGFHSFGVGMGGKRPIFKARGTLRMRAIYILDVHKSFHIAFGPAKRQQAVAEDSDIGAQC